MTKVENFIFNPVWIFKTTFWNTTLDGHLSAFMCSFPFITSAALTTLLETDADSYTWTAATIGANNASGYQLATQEPVMAIGGFNGSDPSPTLAQFEQYVANGQIHYYADCVRA